MSFTIQGFAPMLLYNGFSCDFIQFGQIRPLFPHLHLAFYLGVYFLELFLQLCIMKFYTKLARPRRAGTDWRNASGWRHEVTKGGVRLHPAP